MHRMDGFKFFYPTAEQKTQRVLAQGNSNYGFGHSIYTGTINPNIPADYSRKPLWQNSNLMSLKASTFRSKRSVITGPSTLFSLCAVASKHITFTQTGFSSVLLQTLSLQSNHPYASLSGQPWDVAQIHKLGPSRGSRNSVTHRGLILWEWNHYSLL